MLLQATVAIAVAVAVAIAVAVAVAVIVVFTASAFTSAVRCEVRPLDTPKPRLIDPASCETSASSNMMGFAFSVKL